MTIDLSRRDYLALLTVLEIADWVLHAYSTEDPPETAAVRALEQKVLERAEDFGCGELVEYDARGQRHVLAREAPDASDAADFLEQFENDNFWEQLSDRLVERDLLRQLGEPAFRRLDAEELEERGEPYRRLYGEEFLTHGVERLEILQQGIMSDPGAKSKLS